MRIILTRTLNATRGFVKGAAFDWARPVITDMEKQVGRLNGKFDKDGEPIPDKDWYRFSGNLVQSANRIVEQAELEDIEEEELVEVGGDLMADKVKAQMKKGK